jgi:hypothetical protein
VLAAPLAGAGARGFPGDGCVTTGIGWGHGASRSEKLN